MANENQNRDRQNDRQNRDENLNDMENTNTSQVSGQKDQEERDMSDQEES